MNEPANCIDSQRLFRIAAPTLLVVLLTALSGCGEQAAEQAALDQANAAKARAEAERDRDSSARDGRGADAPPAPPGSIELVFPYGSEKKNWLEAVTKEFNAQQQKTESGKPIYVRAIAMGSGELTTEILEGRLKAHLASPASAAFITLGNAESEAKTGKPLVGKTENLVLSPVVIAMWKPMAEALGWPDQPVGWAEILAMANSTEGWAQYGYKQWGKFKFGHTHPMFSNSGLISLLAEVYAGAGKVRGLTLDDVARPEVAEFLGSIEKSVVHYGSSTGFFGRKLFDNGPEFLSAAVLYENMIIESYDPKYSLPFPVVAIYPKEGTFWSDHPVGIVQRDWVSAEHQEAAEKYIAYLLESPQQQRAMEFGFRPADIALQLTAPIDAAHGVDPQQPQTTLEVPPANVMNEILGLWKKHKKHANILLALDISGSMKNEGRLAGAKEGAKELIKILGDEDQLSLLLFNHTSIMTDGSPMKMATHRADAVKAVESTFADGGTALYKAIDDAIKQLSAQPTPDMITAVVVLSDGTDEHSRELYNLTLPQLLVDIRTDAENQGTRIFTIGYGAGADKSVLTQIADETKAKFYVGDPQTIREVFKEISTFF